MKRAFASLAFVFALGAAPPATDSALLHPALAAAKAPSHYAVGFKTTAGTFVVAVTRAWSPRGADRFYNLVKHGFFNGGAFFRVVPGFVVQFGLNPSPAVDSAWSGADVKDDPVVQSNRAGYLSFAAAGPNTRTTQIFINLGDNPRLDGMGFAPFGKVVSGMSTVRRIYAGYGESPDQGAIAAQGKAYLDKQFPKLDKILSAKLVTQPPAGAH
ncbi:MAG TPA: peptidylprolyl isomerase [Candidatus Tumulicola sp.]|jgi:peptidyl-prolyl cis-trans isomerase A (cyclophilin A)